MSLQSNSTCVNRDYGNAIGRFRFHHQSDLRQVCQHGESVVLLSLCRVLREHEIQCGLVEIRKLQSGMMNVNRIGLCSIDLNFRQSGLLSRNSGAWRRPPGSAVVVVRTFSAEKTIEYFAMQSTRTRSIDLYQHQSYRVLSVHAQLPNNRMHQAVAVFRDLQSNIQCVNRPYFVPIRLIMKQSSYWYGRKLSV